MPGPVPLWQTDAIAAGRVTLRHAARIPFKKTKVTAMRKIRILSQLRGSFREELERIVFFNPEQTLVTGTLVDLVRRYGIPAVVEEGDCLRFRVNAFGMLQTLYAIDSTENPERLVGVAMFTRIKRSTMVVLHLAVHEDYTSHGKWRSEGVVAQLITAIRSLSLRTRGVRTLQVLYPHEIRFELRASA
jgi:hypothetical protein